ncbi:V-type ATP synthase subunit I [Thermococcus atlanticus]
MFKPEEMAKIEVISLGRYKDRVLTYLHEEGAVEVREVEVKLAQKDVPNEFYRKAASYSIGISRLVDFLRAHKKEGGGGLREFFFPPEKKKKTYRYRGIEQLIKDVETFLEKVEPEIKAVEGKLNATQTEMERIRAGIAILELLSVLNIEVEYLKSTDMLEIVVGTVDKDKHAPLLEDLKRTVGEKFVGISKELKDRYLVLFVFLRKDYEKANPVLAKHSLERLEIPEGKGTPGELAAEYRKKLREKEAEFEKARKEAEWLSERYYEDVLFYHELMENERDKATILSSLARTNMTFALTGWLPKEKVPDVVGGIRRITENKAYISIRDPEPGELDEIPIKLKNPKFIEPFEMLTEMFGVPKYNEFDPTPIMAFTYSFFFGFMLTDFMYGLIIGIVAALLIKGHKHLRDGTWKFANILLFSSFFTMLLGILFGSYFGNALDLAGIHVPRLLDTMKGALTVLEIALAIGLIHMFIGYTIGFMVKLRNGETKEALLEQLSWMLIIIAVVLFVISKDYPGLALPAKGLFGAGFVLFVLSELKNGGLAALLIISDFFGFVGNWLSYARLMALALATAGIAMVVNILVQMVWGIRIGAVPIGIVLGIPLFIGGQFFSTAINSLGAFVHSLRLHYVEFFGTFYSGEGRRFEPFRAKREISKLELEFEA